MELEFSEQFRRAYRRLTRAERNQVQRALGFLRENPRHPSLRARRFTGSGLWYARVSRDLRRFYRVTEDIALLVDVGHHDIERSM